jgi:hypothetical protein
LRTRRETEARLWAEPARTPFRAEQSNRREAGVPTPA